MRPTAIARRIARRLPRPLPTARERPFHTTRPPYEKRKLMKAIHALLTIAAVASTGLACAAPVSYEIDPNHTYPSFEADHLGGVSVWRGKFTKTTGKVTMDKEVGVGTLDVDIDPASADFGQKQLNEKARSPELFDTKKFPRASYRGKLVDFVNGAPTRVTGALTLHGVTRPVDLKINSFKCIPHPMFKRELCGADAYGVFKRDAFGMDAGKDYGFNMDVTMRIQVEAIAAK
jgi:polyisoprenoid-binding protein YceI